MANGLPPYVSYTEGFTQNVGQTITGDGLDPSESKQWEIGLRYVSSYYATQSNARETPGHTLVEAAMGCEVADFELDLGITNLLDKKYDNGCYDGYGCSRGKGRIFTVGLSRKFWPASIVTRSPGTHHTRLGTRRAGGVTFHQPEDMFHHHAR